MFVGSFSRIVGCACFHCCDLVHAPVIVQITTGYFDISELHVCACVSVQRNRSGVRHGTSHEVDDDLTATLEVLEGVLLFGFKLLPVNKCTRHRC